MTIDSGAERTIVQRRLARNIPAGTAVGECVEVQRAEAPPQGERAAEGAPLPSFLEDLATRSAVNLTEAQTELVCDTLGRYADVFSQSASDLGRTSLVKHTINTGTHAPVKSPPRRIAPARREEMQRAVNDLATGRPPDVDLPTVTSGFAAALQERFAE
ncbi:hypothetical protein O3P69_010910, partial [Scylla paramamosain]